MLTKALKLRETSILARFQGASVIIVIHDWLKAKCSLVETLFVVDNLAVVYLDPILADSLIVVFRVRSAGSSGRNIRRHVKRHRAFGGGIIGRSLHFGFDSFCRGR